MTPDSVLVSTARDSKGRADRADSRVVIVEWFHKYDPKC